MLQASREEFTRIQIDPSGAWYTGHLRIQNKKVLNFFKKNLHQDDKGIYIYNEFGAFSEKGYITVKGPILKVVDLKGDHFTLENDEIILTKDATIILDKDFILYVKVTRLCAWAVLEPNAAMQISESLEEIQGDFFWGNKKIIIQENINWFESTGES